MQFHQLYDSYESYELSRSLPYKHTQILSLHNDMQIHQLLPYVISLKCVTFTSWQLVRLVRVTSLESSITRLEQVVSVRQPSGSGIKKKIGRPLWSSDRIEYTETFVWPASVSIWSSDRIQYRRLYGQVSTWSLHYRCDISSLFQATRYSRNGKTTKRTRAKKGFYCPVLPLVPSASVALRFALKIIRKRLLRRLVTSRFFACPPLSHFVVPRATSLEQVTMAQSQRS